MALLQRIDGTSKMRPDSLLSQSQRKSSVAKSELDADRDAIRILRVPVSAVNLEKAVAIITAWARGGASNYVCVRDVHGVMLAQADAEFMAIHERSGLVTPDGMPLVWIGRLRASKSIGRVCGADLVDAVCAASVAHGLKHFFYGGKTGIAEEMAANLRARYAGLETVGAFSPPFRSLSKKEDDAIVDKIADAAPNIIWIGLSTPKQEYWMRDHVGRIPGAILIGVGAAFDFHSGAVVRAPKWMQFSGLEWLHRLYSEPHRLWRRYLIMVPQFACRAFVEQIYYYLRHR